MNSPSTKRSAREVAARIKVKPVLSFYARMMRRRSASAVKLEGDIDRDGCRHIGCDVDDYNKQMTGLTVHIAAGPGEPYQPR